MRKLLLSLACVLLTASLAMFFVSCDGGAGTGTGSSNSSEQVSEGQALYTVTVKSVNGLPIAGVNVQLKSGASIKKQGKTDAAGKISLALNKAVYSVVLTDIPEGYLAPDTAVTTDALGSPVNVYLKTQLIESAAPSGTRYTVGSVMHDFTINLNDGSQFNLKNQLQNKQAVVLNFWATWCGPCVAEFPHFQEAYESVYANGVKYKDVLSILALTSYDSNSAASSFASANGYTFTFANDSLGFMTKFGVSNIPHTFIVDRYGVVVFSQVGSMPDVYTVKQVFNSVLGDSYKPPVLQGTVEDDPSGGEGEGEDDRILPTATMPASTEIEAVINADNYNYGYYAEVKDEYSWPWVISDDGTCIKTSNYQVDNSYSIIYSDFTVPEGAVKNSVLAFDYLSSTENDADILYVQVDGVIQARISGRTESWATCYAYIPIEAGDHTLSLTYLKDAGAGVGDDTVYVKNMRFVSTDEITISTNIRRYAAWGEAEEGSETKYGSYITPVYNENDGYYHVNSEDGPLLLADLLYGTQWNNQSIWNLALNGYFVFDGLNYEGEYETYAWAQNNNLLGLCTVNEELRTLLEMATEKVGSGYGEEWLEICCYYDHYGPGSSIEDPIRGLLFESAIPVHEGNDNHVVAYLPIVPRGYKHVFIPERSGVYEIYSTGSKDTFGWLANEDEAIYAENDDNGVTNTNKNFHFSEYMEAGRKYYILCGFANTAEIGTYDFTIEYVASYLEIFTPAAKGPYTNLTDTVYYVPDAIDYMIEDGYVYERREDGTRGSIIYFDFVNYTENYQGCSIEYLYKMQDTEVDEGETPYPTFRLNGFTTESGIVGKDYTKTVGEYIKRSKEGKDPSDELYGRIELTEELYEIMYVFFEYNIGFVADNQFLRSCYYYRVLGEKPAEA